MVIDLNYSVDIRKGVMPQHVTQPLYYDDQNAHRINVSLYRGQQEIDLTGLSCHGYVTFVKDGTSIGPLVGEVSGNTCSVVLPHEAYYYPGAIRIEVKLIEGEEVTTVLMLTGQVSAGRGDHVIDIDGAIVPSLDSLGQLISDMQDLYDELVETGIESLIADVNTLEIALTGLIDLDPIPSRTYYHMVMGSCYQTTASVDNMTTSTSLATVPQIIPADARTLYWDDTIYKVGMVPLVSGGYGRGDFYWYETSPHTFNASAGAIRTFMIRRKDGNAIGSVNLDRILYGVAVSANPITAAEQHAVEYTDTAIASIASGFVKYDFPADFTWTDNPVAGLVTTDGKGRFRAAYNVLDHISTSGLDVYMAADGNDSNDGLTSETPKLTLAAAIGISDARRVHIAGGYYPREYIQSLSKDIDIIGDPNNRPVFTGQTNNITWTATSTTGVYTTAHKNYGKLYDLTAITGGMFRSYTEANSVGDVQSTQGTYYDDGTTLTMHTFGNIAPTVANTCYTQGWPAMRIVLSGHTLIMANLCFVCSGTYSSMGQLMLVGDDSTRGTFMLYNCDSSYSVRPDSTNISGGSCFNPSNADGIIQYCTSYHSGNDGFSYGVGCKVVEIGCSSAYNGTDQLTSCNGSTAHGGSYIRINGAYHDTHGPIVHDVGATESVNLGLSAWHSTCEGKPNFCASGGYVKMWLDSCVGYSSDAGIDVGKPDESAPNAVIYKRNCTSDLDDGVYGGHIYRY